MKNTQRLVSLVAVFALALFAIANVSAFATLDNIEVSDVNGFPSGDSIATFAGDVLPVRVTFTANENVSDARVKVWITGDKDYTASSERFDLIEGRTYTKLIALNVPYDIDPDEEFRLVVSVEDQELGEGDKQEVFLTVQRDSYAVELLDVSVDPNVKAGENLVLDVVIKNRGRHFAEDTFVKVRIPALGIERKMYFGDLSPVDQPLESGSDDRLDNEDAAERRMYISIPSSAPAGVYLVEIEVYNSDSASTVTKKVAVVGSSEDSTVISSAMSKTFAPGVTGDYSITLVNSGNKIQIYDFVFEAPTGLQIDADESVVAVPAGSSKTVKVHATADKAGKYAFAVNVYSGKELVTKENYVANVEGSKSSAGNTTVVLTVILAIIFVVLLVVLIVLLTRKPQKTEEFGESYY